MPHGATDVSYGAIEKKTRMCAAFGDAERKLSPHNKKKLFTEEGKIYILDLQKAGSNVIKNLRECGNTEVRRCQPRVP